MEVNLESGARRFVNHTEITVTLSIVAYRGWTAALGTSHVPTVPAGSTMALAFLAVCLGLAAFLRMR